MLILQSYLNFLVLIIRINTWLLSNRRSQSITMSKEDTLDPAIAYVVIKKRAGRQQKSIQENKMQSSEEKSRRQIKSIWFERVSDMRCTNILRKDKHDWD